MPVIKLFRLMYEIPKWNSGVHQGSVPGHLLFLVYINDSTNGLQCKIRYFADNTSIFSLVHDPVASVNATNKDQLKLCPKSNITKTLQWFWTQNLTLRSIY